MKNKYLLPIKEAADIYGIGRTKLYELVKSEPDIPIVRIGEITKINAPLFENWLNKCTEEGRAL